MVAWPGLAGVISGSDFEVGGGVPRCALGLAFLYSDRTPVLVQAEAQVLSHRSGAVWKGGGAVLLEHVAQFTLDPVGKLLD